jgi:multiple sugar transport system permease protein
VTLVPNYAIIAKLGWIDTYAALIVPFAASVFGIFIMRQFFQTIPLELWDAAQIDGCGRFRYLWSVMVPLSRPVFITSGLFTFIGGWNSFLWPLIVTNTPKLRTIQVGLSQFNQEFGTKPDLLMAASTVAIAPLLVLFFVAQKHLIQGIAHTGLKS